MDIQVKIAITAPDGEIHEFNIAAFEKGHVDAAEIGLTIEESKELLVKLQREIVAAQTAAFCAARSTCPSCAARLRRKGSKRIQYRTVFGDITINSPRLNHCGCQPGSAQTFSPLTELLPDHVAPEMLWLETKWASLVSYGITVDLLKDVLPIGKRLNAETVRRHLGRVASRMEAELADERYSFIETCAFDREHLPNPEGPITVGIDGGYVRSREKGQSHFEVMVGKSIPTDQPDRYLGLVQSHDEKPKRRLHEVLKEQGWQENQQVTFMTDGGETVINIARNMAPACEHLLDWFHVTMRITVMGQYVKGLAHLNSNEAGEMASALRQIKGYLWNGNLHDGQAAIDDLVMDLDEIETEYASIKALRKAAAEFQTYIANTAWMIPNYAERRRYGERVSTGFVESTVNTVVGKRFCKRQQMRWSKTGAHLMLQTRTRTLDGTLRTKFRQWYPGMKPDGEAKMAA
ncbi:ISKra4 family transposase [Pseudovibrio sp. Tun.PSC04-5.I4]|uniref:ISKra4 family transposase n=1 Tax=Pseudovibrio sp. Tun.PSC04-5.I4 TaxID=1798213 RepID=UPI00089158AB|nr:ISKra4 family transposase [Pseudovibrio sp. Tun.PSC04-5.I4]SDQ37430.1 hypothetical protein SAMN04515695_1018 [Pseudovibrio sp. Tun.PSC04-5.I4]